MEKTCANTKNMGGGILLYWREKARMCTHFSAVRIDSDIDPHLLFIPFFTVIINHVMIRLHGAAIQLTNTQEKLISCKGDS